MVEHVRAVTVKDERISKAHAHRDVERAVSLVEFFVILGDFADFGFVVVVVVVYITAAEHAGIHGTFAIEAVGTVEVEAVDGSGVKAADEVLKVDGAGEAERVVLEGRDAVREVGDRGRLGSVGLFERGDAVADADLVAAQQDDELANVGDIAGIASDGLVVNLVDDGVATGFGASFERLDTAVEQIQHAVDGVDLIGVLGGLGQRLAGGIASGSGGVGGASGGRVGCIRIAVGSGGGSTGGGGVIGGSGGGRSSGVGLGRGGIDVHAQRSELVLDVTEDFRVHSGIHLAHLHLEFRHGGFEIGDAGAVAGYVVTETGDDAAEGGHVVCVGSHTGRVGSHTGRVGSYVATEGGYVATEGRYTGRVGSHVATEGGHVIGDAGDGALGRGKANALGRDVGGQLL